MNKFMPFIIIVLFTITLITTSCRTGNQEHDTRVLELSNQSEFISSNIIPKEVSTFELDFQAVPEGDALSELYFTGGGGGQPSSCLFYSTGQYVKPTISEDYSLLRQRTRAPKLILDGLCTCGLSAEQPVYLSLISSDDKNLFTTEGELYDRNGDCYATHISTIEILPWEPLGTYTVIVSQGEHYLYYEFDVVDSDKPSFYYSPRIEAYVAIGFEPFEEVQIIKFINYDNTAGFKISQAAKLRLDEKGQGILPNNSVTGQIGVLRQNQNGFSYISETNSLLQLNSSNNQ